MNQAPSPRPQAPQEAILSFQLVSLGARWLRIAYRAALAWYRSFRWWGQCGLLVMGIGLAMMVAGCPLWMPRGLPLYCSGAFFLVWASPWPFTDAWCRAGRPRTDQSVAEPSSPERHHDVP